MTSSHASRRSLLATQAGNLAALLEAVLSANPFYRAKFSALPPPSPLLPPGAYLRTAPFTTKNELADNQTRHPPYGTNLTFPLERYTRYHQTSGTSGRPLRWLDTPESWSTLLDSWERVFHVAGVNAHDRILFAFSFGPFLGFWTAFEAAQRLQGLCLPGGGLSSGARLRMLLDNQVTVLCCTPTYALRLAEVARQEHIPLHASRVRLILVAGEPGGSIPAVRQRIAAAWNNARVFDHHGMTEVGPVTHECPAQPGVLHLMEDAYLAEIIDPITLDPAPSGVPGELVLTTLRRIASPLLRYRTGDLVRARFAPDAADVPPCACGTHDLALLGGILGRIDDMIIVRGVNLYPSALDQLIHQTDGVAEYRVTVDQTGSLTELRIEIEPDPTIDDPGALAARLTATLEQSLSLRVPVQFVRPGALPRFESKARRWIRRHPDPDPNVV